MSAEWKPASFLDVCNRLLDPPAPAHHQHQQQQVGEMAMMPLLVVAGSFS